jgi:hypothetical protein
MEKILGSILGSQHFRPPSYIDNSTYFQKINDITFNLECNQSCFMCPNVICSNGDLIKKKEHFFFFVRHSEF